MFHPYLRNRLFSESDYRESEDRRCFLEPFPRRVFGIRRFDLPHPDKPEFEILRLRKLGIPIFSGSANSKTQGGMSRRLYSMGKTANLANIFARLCATVRSRIVRKRGKQAGDIPRIKKQCVQNMCLIMIK